MLDVRPSRWRPQEGTSSRRDAARRTDIASAGRASGSRALPGAFGCPQALTQLC